MRSSHAVTRISQICLLLALLLSAGAAQAVDEALVRQAQAGLQAATTFLTERAAVGGGYLGTYLPDLSDQWGETHATRDQNWIQPPGSPTVGEAFLRAYEATGDDRYLQAAVQVARSLVYGQLECGGWDYIVDHSPAGARAWYYRHNRGSADAALKRGNNQATFDDDVTQAATRLLIGVDLALKQQDAPIHEASLAALDFILKAQHESGGWAQRYPPSGRGYGDFLTFNDDTIADCVRTLMLASRSYADPRYAAAVARCGDFIIRVQLPAPQASWAQQYDLDLKPAWARRFEPPSVCGGESLNVMRLLIDITLFTDDAKYLKPIPAALDWFARSRLPDGSYARFYELKTNRPLYFTRDTYWLTYSDADMPTHYSFKSKSRPEAIGQTYQEVVAKGLAAYRREREPRKLTEQQRQAAATALEEQVKAALAAQDQEGRWVTTSGGAILAGQPRLDMQTFQRHMKTLSDYLKLTSGR